MRLFIGYDLPAPVRRAVLREAGLGQRIARNVDISVRVEEQPHITVAFLGETPADDVPGVVSVMAHAVLGSPAPFFVEASYEEQERFAWLRMSSNEAGTEIVDRLWKGLNRLNDWEPAYTPWTAHITLFRYDQRPELQPSFDYGKRSEVPATHAEALTLYESVKGQGYRKLASIFFKDA